MTARQDALDALGALGFTALEAEVYAALVKESPVTAYKIAQTLGKAGANVYKAVESLANKGAVIVDDGESRMLRAVPPKELLARLENEFATTRRKAERALERLDGTRDDDRVYQLKTREQVMERARAMLDRARDIAIVDVFPEPLEEIRDAIVRAAARGVRTLVQVYAPLSSASDARGSLGKAEVQLSPQATLQLAAWRGQWLNVVVDGSEHMLALLRSKRGDVVQAIWSGSAYLSVIYLSGVLAEFHVAEIATAVEKGASNRALRKLIANWSSSPGASTKTTPGVALLRERLNSE